MKFYILPVLFSMVFALSPLSQAATALQTSTTYCPKGTSPNSDLKQQLVRISDKQIVVISETPCEAASIGSYSVRLYKADAAATEYLTDEFVDGLMRPRYGFIRKIELTADHKQLKVTIESAGSGSYLSKDVFSFHGDKIVFIKSE